MGVISLPMTMGDYPKQSCVMANFLVINQPSAFKAVLGRPSFKALRAITSIYHLLMKFPTPNNVGQVHGIRTSWGSVTTWRSKLRQGLNRWISSISNLQAMDPLTTPLIQDHPTKMLPLAIRGPSRPPSWWQWCWNLERTYPMSSKNWSRPFSRRIWMCSPGSSRTWRGLTQISCVIASTLI